MTLDQVKVDSTWIAYVNNIGDKCLWANLSPNVRGRIDLLDVSDDVSLLQDIPKNFPVGSAIRVKVKNVDAAANRLDLVAASTTSSAPVTLKTLTDGQILAGKVTKVSERVKIGKKSRAGKIVKERKWRDSGFGADSDIENEEVDFDEAAPQPIAG